MADVRMIRVCTEDDFESIREIVNDGAEAYKGAIPADRLKEPYMSTGELRGELSEGVVFWAEEEAGGRLAGVMGVQPVQDVTLIRHAYVRRESQGRGVGGRLLRHLQGRTHGRMLIGTWAASIRAIGFYQKHGFELVTPEEKDRLLRQYWQIPERQIQTSVVLAGVGRRGTEEPQPRKTA